MKRTKVYSVYILRCSDDSLYTGISKDVAGRLRLHNLGKGARYTRSRRPCKLVYREDGFGVGEALKREGAIKRLSRSMKMKLVRLSVLSDGLLK